MNIHLPLTVGAAGLGDVSHPKGIKRKLGQDTAVILSLAQVAAMDNGHCGFLYSSTKTQPPGLFVVCDKRGAFCRPNHNDWHHKAQLERAKK